MKRTVLFLTLFGFVGFLSSTTVIAEIFRIGEAQIFSHPTLDNDSKGFKTALEEEGFIEGMNVVFDRQNAQGVLLNCEIIARKFEDERVDLIHAISTPIAQASTKVSNKIPIVFSSVIDPVATDLTPNLGNIGTHITGVSYRWPIMRQCRLYQDLVPYAKRWGTIYNPGDSKITSHIKIMKSAIEKTGGKLIEAHISSSSEVMEAAQSLVGRVDAIHITSDYTAVSAFESIAMVCRDNDIPLFAGDRDNTPRGAVAAYGLDYFMIGYTAGKKAARILNGEDPGQIPTDLASSYSLWVSLKHAKEQGLKLPLALIEIASDKLWDEAGNEVIK